MSAGASLLGEQPVGPRSTKGERTRARLLEAAKQVFEETGFLSARISDIAERAELSHGSFYHYFDSKEQIFREVAAAVDARLGAPLGDIILIPGSDLLPHDRLHEALRIYFESYRAEARIMGVIEQVSRYDEHIDELIRTRHREYSEQIAVSIRQLQRRGLADKTLDPLIAAAAVGALTNRFAELWLVQGAIEATMEQGVEQVTKMIVNSLGLAA